MKGSETMSFQENLRYHRKKAGYQQAKDFAMALNISYSTYKGYESQGREPKYETLCRIADLLKVSTDDLLGRTTNILGNKDDYILLKRLDKLLSIANEKHHTDIKIQKTDDNNIYFKNNNASISFEYVVSKKKIINALNKIDIAHDEETSHILSIFLSNTNTKQVIKKLQDNIIKANEIQNEKERTEKIKIILKAINYMNFFKVNSSLENDYFEENK